MQKSFCDWPAEFWGFVIHTNCFAGNFNSLLGSYLTGHCNGFSSSEFKENDTHTHFGWLYLKDNGLLDSKNPEFDDTKFDHVIRLCFDFEHDNNELSGYSHCWQTPSSLLHEFDVDAILKANVAIYNSVAIFMDRPPTKDEENWFLERSKKFAELYQNDLKILKFELIRMRMEQTTSRTWHLA